MTATFLSHYGNPDVNGDGILDADWFKSNIRVFILPWPMALSWDPQTIISRFQAHKLAGDKIIGALSSMLEAADKEAKKVGFKSDAEHLGLSWMHSLGLDRWGGCFNFRLVRGGSVLSNHAWGTAVDINPDIGRMGNFEDLSTYPRWIVEAFESAGFYWGGHFERPDAMHFELH
jgi:hypothetical protein